MNPYTQNAEVILGEAATTEEIEIKAQELSDEYNKVQHTLSINNAIQNLLDVTAQEYRYDNITSVRSYAGYNNAFQTEATTIAQWASECWVVAGTIESDVLNDVREMPSVEVVISELPTLVI